MTTWTDLGSADLDTARLYELLRLRSEVFVVEQDCPYLDMDGLDLLPDTRHVCGTDEDGRLLGYARVLAPAPAGTITTGTAPAGTAPGGSTDGPANHSSAPSPDVRIGRVVVSPRARGQRLGRAAMEAALLACERHWPGTPILLSAQAHLVDFYAGLDFAAVGEEFLEDGIPHVDMRRGA